MNQIKGGLWVRFCGHFKTHHQDLFTTRVCVCVSELFWHTLILSQSSVYVATKSWVNDTELTLKALKPDSSVWSES